MFDAKIFLLFLAFFLTVMPPCLLSADEAPSPSAKEAPHQPETPSAPESTGNQRTPTIAVAPPEPSDAPAIAVTPLGVDRVVIKKGERLLHLMKGDQILKTYKVALGRNPKGHKMQIGDHKTPEGDYIIDWRNPNSKFYLSLHISYPNHKDIESARRLGVAPGGAIMIHGLPNGLGWIKEMHRIVDWTKGCIAVTNEEMEEIWKCVPDGTPIRIES